MGHLTPYHRAYLDWLNRTQSILALHGGSVTAHDQAYGLIYQTLQQQAALWAYIDQFRMLAIVYLLVAPIIFLLQKGWMPGDPFTRAPTVSTKDRRR